MPRIRRRRFVLQSVSVRSGQLHSLLGRFFFQRRDRNQEWLAEDSMGIFPPIRHKSLQAAKKIVVRLFLEREARLRAEKRQKAGVLTFAEKLSRTRKQDTESNRRAS